jgi:hypothetical protein
MGTYSASRTLVVGRAFPSNRNPKTVLVRPSIYPQGVSASYSFLGACQACTAASRHCQGHSIDVQNTCRYYPVKASYDGGDGRPARRSARPPNLRSGSAYRRGAARYSSGLQCEPQQRGEMETARLPSESPQLRSHSPYIAVENRGLTGPYRPRSYAANIPVYRSGAQANGRHLGALVCGPRLVRVRRRW